MCRRRAPHEVAGEVGEQVAARLVNMKNPRSDTGTIAWLASICAGRTTFIVDVVGIDAGLVEPAVPTVR